jgi:hypothetical protein
MHPKLVKPERIDITKRSVVYLTIADGAVEQKRDEGIGIAAQIVEFQEVRSDVLTDARELEDDG